VRATAVGAQTALAQIVALVSAAQAGKGNAQRLADKISAVFVPVVIGVALAAFAGWWLIGHDPALGLTAAVAVVIVACPCSLGLATPVAIMVGTGRGAKLGILIKGVEVLERTRKITTVVFRQDGHADPRRHDPDRHRAGTGHEHRRAAPQAGPSKPTASTRSAGPSPQPQGTRPRSREPAGCRRRMTSSR